MAPQNRVRRIDPRRAKTHRSYTIAEAASLFGVYRNTVRCWTRNGLQIIRARGAILILGDELRRYLASRRAQRRVRCPPGSMYCLKCRAPQRPPDGLVEVIRAGPTTANLRGLCPVCESLMHRRASLARIGEAGFGHVIADGGASAPS